MATLTEMVAAVVVHSSAAAFSHFGVTLEAPAQAEPRMAPADARTIARSPRAAGRVERASACADGQRARMLKT